MQRILIAFVCALPLAACQSAQLPKESLTLPVRGQLTDRSIVFSGFATGYPDGSGDLTIKAGGGFECSGAFQYADDRKSGAGEFECTDGRRGPFKFFSGGRRGWGTGNLDGVPFTFDFGA